MTKYIPGFVFFGGGVVLFVVGLSVRMLEELFVPLAFRNARMMEPIYFNPREERVYEHLVKFYAFTGVMNYHSHAKCGRELSLKEVVEYTYPKRRL